MIFNLIQVVVIFHAGFKRVGLMDHASLTSRISFFFLFYFFSKADTFSKSLVNSDSPGGSLKLMTRKCLVAHPTFFFFLFRKKEKKRINEN